MDAVRSARSHALGYRSCARDVGRPCTALHRLARGRDVQDMSYCIGQDRARRHRGLPAAANTGRFIWLGDVPR